MRSPRESIVLLCATTVAVALAIAPSSAAQTPPAFDHGYGAYRDVLTRFVRDARVDYRALVADRATLDRAIGEIARVSQSDEARWAREDRLAFWINAYNLFTLRSIVDHYPIHGSLFTLYPRNSIRQIDGVWAAHRWPAAARSVTLDEIEHEILRPIFRDPRVHVAVNCASKSCPPLRFEPYIGNDIDRQLDDAARRFLASDQGVKLSAGRLMVSSIFKWYGDDFIPAYAAGGTSDAAIRAFIVRYGPPAAAAAAKTSTPLRFLSYDWSLNDVGRQP